MTYKKDSYSIILFGNNKLKMANIYSNIQDRKKEIVKWTGVTSINAIKVLENKVTDEIILKVSVKQYEDYVTLLGNWGLKAFGIGVNTQRAPLEEMLIIDRVPNSSEYNINCSKNAETVTALKEIGLVEVSRESYEKTDFKNKTTTTVLKNQLKCRPTNMLTFLEAQFNSVLLDMTTQEHVVYPETSRVNTCANCGKFNSHNIKNCPSTVICSRCLLNDHTIESCKSDRIKCVNCAKPHSCNFKGCWSVVNETRKKHQFIFNIILGEKVKKNPYEVLNISEYFNDSGPSEIENNQQVDAELISDMVQQHAHSMYSRLDDHENRIITNTKQINIALDKVQKHDEILEMHSKAIEKHDEQIGSLVTCQLELTKKFSKVTDEISNISTSNGMIASTLLGLKEAVEALTKK
jgi:hypothetical protein